MIGDTLFVVKMLILTLILVVLLQIKVGNHTLEQRSMHFIATSEMMRPLNEVAHGGVLAIKSGFKGFMNLFSEKATGFFNKQNLPGHRDLRFQLKRSEEYIKEKAQRLKEKVETTVENSVEQSMNDYEKRQRQKLSDQRNALRKKLQFKGPLSAKAPKPDDVLEDEIINELQKEGVDIVD